MNQEARQWLDMAQTDLGVAKHLEANYYPKPLEIICYHCQQAVEKGIKALSMLPTTKPATKSMGTN